MNTLLAFTVPFGLSALLIPVVKWISKKTDAWAKQNSRTIHHGIISRIGGIAIFLAFSIGMILFFTPDRSILGIYLCTSVMFLIGLWDDFMDLPAKFKFVLQVLAAMILLYYGVGVDALRILGWKITNPVVCAIFTILWIVGITNAINLLDGLDGLCGGMILVVLSIVCAISIVDRRGDMVLLSLILMGSILGFLLYNSHPASIFMGDCGSLFLGSMVASLSLLGFKSSTMMTLSFPILILLLPIIDTFSAILRRKIKKIPVDQADRSHLHHQLMKRFGQTNSVIIMCAITFGFGLSAFMYIYNRAAGLIAMVVLLFGIEIFIERTGMISSSFHPVHSMYRAFRRLLRKLFGKPNFEDLFEHGNQRTTESGDTQEIGIADKTVAAQAISRLPKPGLSGADAYAADGEMTNTMHVDLQTGAVQSSPASKLAGTLEEAALSSGLKQETLSSFESKKKQPAPVFEYISESNTMSYTDTNLDLPFRVGLMAYLHGDPNHTMELDDIVFDKSRVDTDYLDNQEHITAASRFRPSQSGKTKKSKTSSRSYTHSGLYAPQSAKELLAKVTGNKQSSAKPDTKMTSALQPSADSSSNGSLDQPNSSRLRSSTLDLASNPLAAKAARSAIGAASHKEKQEAQSIMNALTGMDAKTASTKSTSFNYALRVIKDSKSDSDSNLDSKNETDDSKN